MSRRSMACRIRSMSAPTSPNDLAVVTTVWGSYSQWMPDWAQSIVYQTVRPAQVVIAEFGCDNYGPMFHAVQILQCAGIPVTLRCREYGGMGQARNTAVGAAETPWVMHLDADDRLLPWALADVAELQDQADVVCIGARRFNRRAVTFPKASRERVLAGHICCYSCAPFRRSLWAKRPFQTANDWVDSVFWVGLAHLGAQFVPTKRPGFIYRDHPDSFSHQLTEADRQAATRQWQDSCQRWSLT